MTRHRRPGIQHGRQSDRADAQARARQKMPPRAVVFQVAKFVHGNRRKVYGRVDRPSAFDDSLVEIHNGVGDHRQGGQLRRIEAFVAWIVADAQQIERALTVGFKSVQLLFIQPGEQLHLFVVGQAAGEESIAQSDLRSRAALLFAQQTFSQQAGGLDILGGR